MTANIEGSSQRQSTLESKRGAVEFAEANGSMAAEREFDISEKSIRCWCSQKMALYHCSLKKEPFRCRKT